MVTTMPSGPEQPPGEPESTGDEFADKLVARAAKRIVEQKEPEPTITLIPEEERKRLEHAKKVYEAELKDYKDELGREIEKSPSHEIARRRLESRGIFPPKEPGFQDDQQSKENDTSTEEVTENPKANKSYKKPINRPSNRPNVYDRDKNVKDNYDSLE